jgi:ABC-type branched-subunit amino acid transport system ATPase component
VSLAVEELTVAYGGHTAVDSVSLEAPLGRITGLIGPNGAGKTTTFNACTGLVRPASGRICLFGLDVTAERPSTRARRGLGRTYQAGVLFDSLSVAENVAMGAEAALAGANPIRHLVEGRGDREHVGARTDEALRIAGVSKLATSPVRSLPVGQRRLVELARVLAGDFRILLLDEPSAGLDSAETQGFGTILRRIVDDRGHGLFLVEHDVSLVMSVCDHIYVLDFGRLIFAGTPAEVTASQVVRSAYLGPVHA